MSVRSYIWKKVWMLAAMVMIATGLYAQNDSLKFRVFNNNMHITVARWLPIGKVDSFLIKYNLKDIGLHQFMLRGIDDSLLKAGWLIDRADPQRFVFTKPLPAADSGPSGKIIFTPVPTPDDWREVGGNRVVYGINHFRNGREFRREDSQVYFHLRGYTNAGRVRLAGNFTNWQHSAFAMKRDGDGWTAIVNLPPGQYYYKFIVGEDQWMTDPENELSENDGRGNENSVYYVPNRHFHLKGHQDASEVFVTGNFSNWADDNLPMKRDGDGWSIDLYLQPGTWKYYFIVDGTRVKADEPPTSSVGKPYLFTLKGFPNAHKVIVAGDFNDWNENELQMHKTADGWQASYVLGPGNYQYKFIVDGNWITDPANSSVINDGRGHWNSFLVIGANYTFQLKGYPNAREVFLAGDFNSWSPKGVAMQREGDTWKKSIYLAKGKHRYKFLVDGKWILDPANKAWEENEFGTGNSVLWLEADTRHANDDTHR